MKKILRPRPKIVRPLNTQIRRLTGALSRAFFNDPFYLHALPEDPVRRKMMPWLIEFSLRYNLRHGEVFSTPAADGAAIWMPPGSPTFHLAGIFRTGMLARLLRFDWLRLARLARLGLSTERAHRAVMPAPHWYLVLLGVDPRRQGQGLGGRLLQPVLARADAGGLPCYLETEKPENVGFYQRFGFEVRLSGELPDRGPRFWAMVRPPRRQE